MTAPQQPRTPRTEAGKFVANERPRGWSQEAWARMVADIEVETSADLLAQIEKAVDEASEYIAWAELDVPDGRTFEDWHDKGVTMLRAVLVAIRSAAPVEPE